MSVAKYFLLILILSFSSQHVLAVNIGLFGDIRLKATDIKDDPYGFELGDLDFYATQELSDNTRGFVELVFENTSSGIVTDLERLWIMHTFNDEFKLSAGRFHSPLGRWNRTYHHGALVQDTVSRPFFLDFEDGTTGVLPVHLVGVMSTGDIIRKNDEFNYEIAMGNGPSIDSSGGFSPVSKPEIDINVSSDTNKNKTLAARVIYGHDNIPVKIGLFAMTHEIAESAATGGLTNFRSTLIDQTIYGTDFLFTQNKIELLAEYYQFRNKSNVGSVGTYSASAWYIQFNYEIVDNLKIIAREESLSFDKNNDSYFMILGTEQAKHHVLALRYDIDESNAIKFELNAADNDFSTDSTTFTVQWAFLIP